MRAGKTLSVAERPDDTQKKNEEVSQQQCSTAVCVKCFLDIFFFYFDKDIYDRKLQGGPPLAKQPTPSSRWLAEPTCTKNVKIKVQLAWGGATLI